MYEQIEDVDEATAEWQTSVICRYDHVYCSVVRFVNTLAVAKFVVVQPCHYRQASC